MTVDASTFCAASDLSPLVGDIVSNRTFTAVTSPSITDAEAACDNVAAIIHAKLAEEGYPLFTNAVMLATYPYAQPFLKALNVYGACSFLLQSVPGMAIDPSDSSAPNARANQMKKRFDDGIASLKGQVLDNLGLQRLVRRTQRITAVQNFDPVTGFHNEPFFRRGMTDIPGSRSLERP